MNFYQCDSCKTLVYLIEKGGCLPSCCGEKMNEVVIHKSGEQGLEKHVPVVQIEGNKVSVKVGEVSHPMLENHYITWIFLLTDKGSQVKNLQPGMAPEATFLLEEGEVVKGVYAHCNLHGIWEADL